MKNKYKISCPYCGNSFLCALSPGHATAELVYCDVDETNGCGEMFVVKSWFQFKFDHFKIEGQGKQ